MERLQRSQVFSNWVIAVAAVLYLVATVALWLETRRAVTVTEATLEFAKAGGEQARTEARADRELTRRSVEATEKALGLTEESNRQTAQGLHFSEAMTIASTRPWVAVESLDSRIDEQGVNIVRIRFKNGGSTPALKFSGRAFILWGTTRPIVEPEAREEFERQLAWDLADPPTIVIAPHGGHSVVLLAPPFPSSPNTPHQIYVAGQFTYEDFTGKVYRMPFICYYDDGPDVDWVPCDPKHFDPNHP